MIIPIIEVIQTYLFVSCFLKRKVRFGKVLDWLVLIGVSEVGTIGNHYFQDANINILIAVIELFILLSFFEGRVKRKILAGLLYLVFAFLAEGVVAVGLSRAYDIRIDLFIDNKYNRRNSHSLNQIKRCYRENNKG